MTSQVFYRKWRPQTFAEVVGQQHVTQTLLNALKSKSTSHAYLFCGPRGTGKTSTARILAKAVNCLNNTTGEPCNTCRICQSIIQSSTMDIIEIDAASNTGVENVRDLREKVNYAPAQALKKVYIIDEVHMLSSSASNALLKTLEEPPPHVIFILATTEAHKVLPTILSRCQHFDFHRVSNTDVAAKLAKVCTAEGIQIEPVSLHLIARTTTGSLRDAYNLLEQLTTFYGPKIEVQQVQSALGITGDWRAREIVQRMMNKDLSAGMATLSSVSNDGLDLRQFNRELVSYLRALLLIKTNALDSADYTAEDLTALKILAAKATLPQILKAVKLFGQIDLSLDNYSTLPLELALVDSFLSETEKEIPVARQAIPSSKVEEKAVQPVKEPLPKPASAPVKPPAPKTAPEPKSVPPAAVAETAVKSEASAKPAPSVKQETVPPAPKTAAVVPSSPTGLSSEVERLRINWKQMVENAPPDVKKSKAIAFLRSAGIKPVNIIGDTVVLALRYSMHKENLEKPENRQIAEKIISDFLGRACKIQCTCEPDNNHLVRAAVKYGAQVTSVEEK